MKRRATPQTPEPESYEPPECRTHTFVRGRCVVCGDPRWLLSAELTSAEWEIVHAGDAEARERDSLYRNPRRDPRIRRAMESKVLPRPQATAEPFQESPQKKL